MSELDPALVRFQLGRLELAGGWANHGPMAAEALVALGHEALIPAFVDIYAPRLGTLAPGRPLEPSEQPAALGSGADADWVATLLDGLQTLGWRSLLDTWLPRLLPGLFAGATHGLLRTAHAVRALQAEETEVRMRELAFGLAYWASRYQGLPGRPGSDAVDRLPAEVLLVEIPLVPLEQRLPGLFSRAVRVLEDRPEFAASVARLDLDTDEPGEILSSLCAQGAALYLAHPEHRLAYAHCVTAPSALRLLAPHLGQGPLREAAGFAVQAACALHATHGLRGPEAAPIDAEIERLAEAPDEMRYRAACSAEEHAIKLCEACLRENGIAPDPRLRWAAADAAIRMGTSAGARGA